MYMQSGKCTDLKNVFGVSSMKRGSVWMCDTEGGKGSEQAGKKTVVIIQNNIGNTYSPTVIVAFITSKNKKNLPTHVSVDLFHESTVMCEQVRTIDKSRLYNYMGEITNDKMYEIDKAIKVSLDVL